jgi:serine/threonine-protein kinase
VDDDEREVYLVGNPKFLSPEQVVGKPPVAASDVFSLGVVLYEMLTGRYVFAGDTLHHMLFRLLQGERHLVAIGDLAVRDIVRRALEPDPGQRFPDGGAFADALRPMLWDIED